MDYFLYTVDPSAEEPIMLINKHIGFDETDGIGIMGDQFQAELLALDAMGKKRIQVWINSVGGIVMDGYNIYNAILKSKTKVDTYCHGIAASIAGVIFQAGRNRIMSDYGTLMYHNPFGGDDDDMLKSMKASLVTMVAQRSGKSETEIAAMMDRTSWISASEAFASGLCDEIEVSKDQNRKRATTDAKAMWNAANKVLNSLINKSDMKNVANKLGLNPEASESAIVEGIATLQNRAEVAEAKVAELQETSNKSIKDLEDEMASHKDAFEKCKKELDEMKEKAKNADEEMKAEKAKNMVEGFAKIGKIKNEAETIAKWTAKAKDDLEGVKDLLEALPVNKTAVKITDISNSGDQPTAISAALVMAEVQNKTSRK